MYQTVNNDYHLGVEIEKKKQFHFYSKSIDIS